MSAELRGMPPSSIHIVLGAVRRHRVAAILVAGLVLATAIAAIFSITPQFRASALVVLDTRVIRFTDGTSVTSGPANGVDTNIARSETEILGSEGAARQVVTELDLVDNPAFQTAGLLQSIRDAADGLLAKAGLHLPKGKPQTEEEKREAVVAGYRRALSVSNDGRSYAITLTFQSPDRHLAADVVNRHAEDYVNRQKAAKVAALELASTWLDREVEGLSVRLREAERRVQEYRAAHRLFSARGTPVVQQQLADLGAELAKARADLATRDARADQARASGFGRQLESEAAVAKLREAELARIVNELEGQLALTERDEAGARDLERETAAIRSLYENLLGRQKQVAAQAGAQLADAQIVSRAVPPVKPAYPNKALFLVVASMIAAGSGVGAALLLDRRRAGVGIGMAEASGLGLPVLATVPRLSRRQSFADAIVRSPRSEPAESIRTLRSVLATRPGGMPKVMAITSALPQEGKTSVALALARSLAGSGLMVLLVDADLRRSGLARTIWGDNAKQKGPGTAAVLAGLAPLASASHEDGTSPLHILPAIGRAPNPQDLLEAGRLGPLLEAACKIYDYIIIDTPPAAAVSDSLLVGGAVDATLLVVHAEATPAAAVERVVQVFRQADRRLGGLIVAADQAQSSEAQMRRNIRAYFDQ